MSEVLENLKKAVIEYDNIGAGQLCAVVIRTLERGGGALKGV